MKVLIVEDEYNLADAIKSRLCRDKLITNIVTDGEQGLDEALSGVYDLIILDVMLPHINGFEILKEIREFNIDSKVIMLTAKATIDDKLIGFNSGADDYLTKPFHMEELLARVNVLLKRGNKNNKLLFGNVELNVDELKIINHDTGDCIEVIGKEFQLFCMLLENKNMIISKENIFNKVWGFDSESELNCVEAYVSFIRKKLKAIDANINIKSIRNMGYKLELNNEKDKK